MIFQYIQFVGVEGQGVVIWIGMYQQSVELVILFICYQVQWLVIGWGFICFGSYQMVFVDCLYLVDVVFQSWVVVENIDVVQVVEFFFFQYCLGWGGLWMNFVDYCLCFRGKEIDIQWMFGYQGGNESFLFGVVQVVGMGKFYGEKVFVQVFLEW